MPIPRDAPAADPGALRRRYMLAAIRLAQPGDPARLNDRDLFDLFAMLGEPEFCVWQEHLAAWARWQAAEPPPAGAEQPPIPTHASEPDAALTHREFDAQLRRQRA